MEFYVASSAIRPVTGLLAEFNHMFTSFFEEKLSGMKIAPLFEEGVRRTYANPAAVSRMVEGEAGAGETET